MMDYMNLHHLTYKIHLVFHVLLLKPLAPDPFPSQNTGPYELVLLNGDEEY